MTPEEARKYLDTPIKTKVVRRDNDGREIIAPVNYPSIRVLDRIVAKARQ